jgi:hypothetical protein
MCKFIPLFLIASCFLTGCDKAKSAGASANPTGLAVPSDDPVQKKLEELAGRGAKNCGVQLSQLKADLQASGKCAMDAAQSNAPFYVEYQMPGMNVAVAGNEQGKLYSVQSEEGGAGMASVACPAALRLAPSGRVTCYAPGTFPMSAGVAAHTNMIPTIPPMMGTKTASPYKEMPAGHPKVQSNQSPQTPAQQR